MGQTSSSAPSSNVLSLLLLSARAPTSLPRATQEQISSLICSICPARPLPFPANPSKGALCHTGAGDSWEPDPCPWLQPLSFRNRAKWPSFHPARWRWRPLSRRGASSKLSGCEAKPSPSLCLHSSISRGWLSYIYLGMVPTQALGKSGGLGGIYGSVIALLWGPGSGNHPLSLHFSIWKTGRTLPCNSSWSGARNQLIKVFILTDKSCDLFSYSLPRPLSFLAVL